MDNIVLKVQPQVLMAKAAEISNEKDLIIRLLDQAKTEIGALSDLWISEASMEYQKRFRLLCNDVEHILVFITGYISDLNEVAGIYSGAERVANTKAEGLPTEGIFRV